MRILTIIFGLALLTLTACGTTKGSKNTSSSGKKSVSLDGEWILQNENNNEIGIGNKPLSISLEKENNAYGFAGCNNFNATYSIENQNINFSNFMLTRMACPDLKSESKYLDLLKKVTNFKIKGNNLYMYQDKILLLHFKR